MTILCSNNVDSQLPLSKGYTATGNRLTSVNELLTCMKRGRHSQHVIPTRPC